LADSYEMLGPDDLPSMKDACSRADAAVHRALELDNSLGEAHTVLAVLTFKVNRDWRGAESEFKKAIELSPGYATAYQRYSTLLSIMGRHEESLRAIHKAQALDPVSPSINGGLGARLLYARRYREAIEQLQKALEMDPNLGLTHRYLGWLTRLRDILRELLRSCARRASWMRVPSCWHRLHTATQSPVKRIRQKVFSKTWKSGRDALTFRHTNLRSSMQDSAEKTARSNGLRRVVAIGMCILSLLLLIQTWTIYARIHAFRTCCVAPVLANS
jgi:tetratricopeptide (TPR) repeat protein